MKLAMLRRPATMTDELEQARTLMVVGRPAEILSWPGEPSARPEPAVVELRSKVFGERQVEQEQYSLTVNAGSRSVGAILAALADAAEGVEDFARALGGDEQLILSIQVRM